MRSEDIRLSKYMSFVLRHRPETAGLVMDERGWASVDALVEACIQAGHAGSRDDVLRVVTENDKQRFELSSEGDLIRAAQGHSINLELGLAPVAPPPVLFHGTVEAVVDRIRAEGVRPMGRTHVHLSGDSETARRVGLRRGSPVVLHVDAAAMSQSGFEFFEASNGVWLVAEVPAEYLAVSEPQTDAEHREPDGKA